MEYHLKLSSTMLEGAKYAFLPGDPQRARKIATFFDPQAKELAINREFNSWLGYLNGVPILTTSTGIGGPSTAIVIEELARVGIDTFIRLGTSGAIQEHIKVHDLIITTGSVRLDGTSRHYAPIEYPAVAHHEVTQVLVQAAKKMNVPYHVGLTTSSDSFYPGQQRPPFGGYIIKTYQDRLQEWQKLHILNYEMESGALLTLGNVFGLRCGCVTCVLVNRVSEQKDLLPQETPTPGEERLIKIGVEAMSQLIKADPGT